MSRDPEGCIFRTVQHHKWKD